MEIFRCILYFCMVVCVLSQRIGEGVEVHDPTMFPFFAVLKIRFPYNSTHNNVTACGGSLIHLEWILTASHCVPNDTSLHHFIVHSHENMVFMGSVHVTRTQFRQARRIKSIHRHPEYILHEYPNGTIIDIRNDIVLLKVHKPFRLSEAVHPIPLQFKKCKYVIAIGRGRIRIGSNELSNIVKYAKLVTDFGGPVLHNTTFIASSEVGNTDYEASGYALRGDSGGPIICDNISPPFQIGVISAGHVDDDRDKLRVENIIERVDLYIDSFIAKYVPLVSYAKAKRHINKKHVSNSERQTVHVFTIFFIHILYTWIA